MIPGVIIHDIRAVRREQDGVTFVPAVLDFDDTAAVAKVKLFDKAMRKDARYRAAERYCGASDELYTFPSLWLRSRVMAEFHLRFPFAGGEEGGGLLEIPFLAAVPDADGRITVHPFVCDAVEDGAEARLEFSRSWSPPPARSVVAAAFRSLLLRDALNLARFDEWCVQGEDYDWGLVACGIARDGTAYDEELIGGDPEDGPPEPIGEHVVLPGFPGLTCDMCGGEGEESLFPAGEICERCGGTGRVSWVETWPFSRKRPRQFACRIFDRRS